MGRRDKFPCRIPNNLCRCSALTGAEADFPVPSSELQGDLVPKRTVWETGGVGEEPDYSREIQLTVPQPESRPVSAERHYAQSVCL